MILLNRLFVADYSSLKTIPLVPGNVLYAPQVRPKAVFIQNMIFLVLVSSPFQNISYVWSMAFGNLKIRVGNPD